MKNDRKIVYKIVKRKNGKLISFIVRGKALVEYKPGEWTEAPEWLRKHGHHLLAFKTLEDARKEYKPGHEAEIWKCECEGYSENLPALCDLYGLTIGFMIPLDSLIYNFPPGTVMCEKIKLLERIMFEGDKDD